MGELQSMHVCMSSSNIFSLQMLKLGVDIEPVTGLHDIYQQELRWKKNANPKEKTEELIMLI